MSSMTQGSPYQMLLQQVMQNQGGGQQGGAQGFMQPGSMPLQNGGMPNVPRFSGGGAGGMGGGMMPPVMPQGASTTPTSGASQAGGMFSNLANNPMLMGMLAQHMGGQQSGQSPNGMPQPGNAGGFNSGPLSSPGNTAQLQTLFNNGGNNPFAGGGNLNGQISPSFWQRLLGGGSGQ